MATSDGRDDKVVASPRPQSFAGDDITIEATAAPEPGATGRRRLVALGVALLAAVVVGVTALVVASNRSPAKPTAVQTIPPATNARARVRPASSSPRNRKHSTATSVPAAQHPSMPAVAPPTVSVPRASTPVSSTPVTTTLNATVPPSSVPLPPLGPNALQFGMTPGRTITIPAGGYVRLGVTVHNPTTRAAYLPTPLSCLEQPGHVCPQTVELVTPGLTLHESFTLWANDFSTTPTQVRVGGYAIITVKVASS